MLLKNNDKTYIWKAFVNEFLGPLINQNLKFFVYVDFFSKNFKQKRGMKVCHVLQYFFEL